jgi:phosphoribosylaminoimidazole carboxylase PurE protein
VKKQKPLVGVIMGSQNDMRVMKDAVDCLKQFKIPHEVEIVSAHRTPDWMYQFALKAQKRGLKAIIAGAGGAAHLPGMVASLTTLPVIGVPVLVGKLAGMDALLSIVQMPKGVPVASVAIDNAFNAGLLAARILGTDDAKIQKLLQQFQTKQKKKILAYNKK